MIEITPENIATLQADVFGTRPKPRQRIVPAATPSRPSGLSSVSVAASEKFRRRDFYLKIDGLTGPRKVAAKDSAA